MNELIAAAVRGALHTSKETKPLFPKRAEDLPETLCRFRSFDAPFAGGKDKDAVFELLRGRIHFKKGSTFNDPFEGRPGYVPAYADEAEQRKAMRDYLIPLARSRGIHSAESFIDGKLASQPMALLVDELGSTLRGKTHDDVTILCVAHPDTISAVLPWSHYGDSHRGVCIELDTSRPPVHFAMQVAYSEDYPTLLIPRTTQDEEDRLRKTFLTKALDWKYEHEYRAIRILTPDAGIAAHLFVEWDGEVAKADPKIVKRLTFGAIMPEPTRAELIAWMKEYAADVEVWQAKLHKSRYEVERERIA